MIDKIKEKFFGPKATLEFNLGDYEQEMAFKRAVQSTNLALALWDISRIPREWEKHPKELNADETDGLYRNRIFETFEKYNINLEDLME